MQLYVNGSSPIDNNDYAGITLQHVAGPPPADSPNFWFAADQSGSSGGSPRLVMVFSGPDGTPAGSINLAPDTWDGANSWQHVDDGFWSANSAACPYTYHDDYDHAVECMGPGAVVTDAFVVSDSGWLHNGGYNNWVDQIEYGDTVLSQPADNANS